MRNGEIITLAIVAFGVVAFVAVTRAGTGLVQSGQALIRSGQQLVDEGEADVEAAGWAGMGILNGLP